MFHWLPNLLRSQTFEPGDLAIVALLVLLEGVLSIDNALVLGVQVRRLPTQLRAKALTYGLVGAMILRIAAIALAAWLLQTQIVKLLGGVYLIYLAGRHFLKRKRRPAERKPAVEEPMVEHAALPTAISERASDIASEETSKTHFWWTVIGVELSDLAFAIDSILAAIAMVSGRHGVAARPGAAAQMSSPASAHIHPKLWVVVTGGMLGVLLMRFAAAIFVRVIDRFPRFESSAYLLVAIVGVKLLSQWIILFADASPPDFENPRSLAFWVYWILTALAVVSGFFQPRKAHEQR